ncbi:hypothetical protein [Aestuariivirga sp.]|uniref:hypothetical protein n=1 Tax=Aestuariivirga sp. TaxID=2650926 RepID=UPI0039E50D56
MAWKSCKLLTAMLFALLFGMTGLARANLVTNGGFESGSFSGWTLTGDTSYTTVNSGSNAYAGTYYGSFGSTSGQAYLSQTIVTTIGASYTVSFRLANVGNILGTTSPNSFSASFGSSLVSMTNSKAFGYTLYTYLVTATAATTTLQFSFYNVPGYYRLDAVNVDVVAAVPLPGSLPLLSAGLIGLCYIGRRRAQSLKPRI